MQVIRLWERICGSHLRGRRSMPPLLWARLKLPASMTALASCLSPTTIKPSSTSLKRTSMKRADERVGRAKEGIAWPTSHNEERQIEMRKPVSPKHVSRREFISAAAFAAAGLRVVCGTGRAAFAAVEPGAYTPPKAPPAPLNL